MQSMFNSCNKITSLDISNFSSESLAFKGHTFTLCDNLEAIEFDPNFKTNNIQYMDGMFRGCSKLKILDLSSFDTSSAVTMEWMFEGCSL